MARDGTWFCYMLECRGKSLYVGVAKDPEKRVQRHNRGIGSKYTAKRLPVTLIWYEQHASEASARGRESELKGWRREKKLALLLAGKLNPSPKKAQESRA